MEELATIDELAYLKILSRTIIHDYNNILGAIYGAISIIKFDMEEDKEIVSNKIKDNIVNDIKEEIHEIDLASKKSFKLINILHQNIKKNAFITANHDIKLIIDNLIEEILSNLKDKININFLCKTNLTTIKCNSPLIKILFYNLIKNSIESIQKNETTNDNIDITINNINNHLIVTLNDTGIEFDSTNSINYFSLLYTTKNSEYGLGLPVSASIVRIHGGMIKINSEEKNDKIFVSFPLSN